jgi:hypothetical protein
MMHYNANAPPTDLRTDKMPKINISLIGQGKNIIDFVRLKTCNLKNILKNI